MESICLKLMCLYKTYIWEHCNDAIMSARASQIVSLTIVYSTVYLGADKKRHQSSSSLALVRGIHRWPVNSPCKARNAKNVSIWWRHHETSWYYSLQTVHEVQHTKHTRYWRLLCIVVVKYRAILPIFFRIIPSGLGRSWINNSKLTCNDWWITRMSLDLTDDTSELVQVKAWHRQAPYSICISVQLVNIST